MGVTPHYFVEPDLADTDLKDMMNKASMSVNIDADLRDEATKQYFYAMTAASTVQERECAFMTLVGLLDMP